MSWKSKYREAIDAAIEEVGKDFEINYTLDFNLGVAVGVINVKKGKSTNLEYSFETGDDYKGKLFFGEVKGIGVDDGFPNVYSMNKIKELNEEIRTNLENFKLSR